MPWKDWHTAALGFVGALVGGFVVPAFNYYSETRNQDIRLVEIGIGILKSDPKEEVTPARAWAITVIEKYSGVEFDAKDREALLKKPIEFGFLANDALGDIAKGYQTQNMINQWIQENSAKALREGSKPKP